jgi:WD40 repeat protein
MSEPGPEVSRAAPDPKASAAGSGPRAIPQRRRLRPFVMAALLASAACVVLATALLCQDIPLRISASNAAQLTVVQTVDEYAWKLVRHPDGRHMAFVGWEKPVQIRETRRFEQVDEIGQGKRIIHFAFSPAADKIAFCETGTTMVEVHDRGTGQRLELDAQSDQPGMEFSPDGQLLVAGGYGTTVPVWDIASGELVRTLDTGARVKGGLTPAFSPDGKILAVGNRNATTCLFDVATGKLLHELPNGSTHGLRFNPSGTRLAIGYVDGSVRIWSVADGRLLAERKTPAQEIYAVDWSPDGSLLATCGLKGAITIWRVGEDLEVVRELPAPEWVIDVKFSADGRTLVTSGGTQAPGERTVRVWAVRVRDLVAGLASRFSAGLGN